MATTTTHLILLTSLFLTCVLTQHAPTVTQHVHKDFQTFEPEVSDIPEIYPDDARVLIMYRPITTTTTTTTTTTATPTTTAATTTPTTTAATTTSTAANTTNNTAANTTNSTATNSATNTPITAATNVTNITTPNTTNVTAANTTANNNSTTITNSTDSTGVNSTVANTAVNSTNSTTNNISSNDTTVNSTSPTTNNATTSNTVANSTNSTVSVNSSNATTTNTTTPTNNTVVASTNSTNSTVANTTTNNAVVNATNSTTTTTNNNTTANTTTTVNTTNSTSSTNSTTSTSTNTTANTTTSSNSTSSTSTNSTSRPIRIAVDFQLWTETVYANYVQTQLVPAVVSYLQAALKVRYPLASKITSNSKTLCGWTTPKVLSTGGVDADLFVFFNSANDTINSWIGATTICTVSSGVNRPMIINIGLNIPYLPFSTASTPLNHDLNINILLHEFIHGLGQNGAVYNLYVDSTGAPLTNVVKKVMLSGTNRTVLDLPPLTERLRKYYGCPTVPGLFIENDGTSHPENRFYQWDVMASGGIIGSRISEINLAFLEATGWYDADYSYAEPYFFGQGQGCDFFANGTAASKFSPEYCTGTGIGCTEVGDSGGYCVTTSALENYRVYTSQPLFNCENPSSVYYVPFAYKQVYGRGLGSKCFTGNLTTYSSASQGSYCLKYTCVGSGADTVLNVMWGSTTLTCTDQGPLSVPGFLGSFNCPDPLTYCSTVGKVSCRKNCMGRGQCVQGQCICNAGFAGTDCGMTSDFQ